MKICNRYSCFLFVVFDCTAVDIECFVRVDYLDVADYIVHEMVVEKCDGAVGNVAGQIAAAVDVDVAATVADRLDYCAEGIVAAHDIVD